MGTAGAKAFGDVLRVNKTLQHLNVSNNSFGHPVVGDQVKLKSSGEMCTVHTIEWNGKPSVHLADGSSKTYLEPGTYDFDSQPGILGFCTGLAASTSLLSVSIAASCNGRL